MTKDTLGKMLAGLSPEEQKTTLAELGITDTAAQAELISLAATHGNAVAVQQPAVVNNPAPAVQNQAAPVQQAQAQPALPAIFQQQQPAQQQATADNGLLMRAITAECHAFMTANAGKITPAEAADVQKLYIQLGQMADPSALNQYKASIQARPTSPMLTEQVASAGAVVLNNNQQAVDTRTEAQKDADAVTALLNMTEGGQQAAHAMKAGTVEVASNDGKVTRPVNLQGAFKQFAINAPQLNS
jgi:hypothetical protein